MACHGQWTQVAVGPIICSGEQAESDDLIKENTACMSHSEYRRIFFFATGDVVEIRYLLHPGTNLAALIHQHHKGTNE